MDDFEKTWKEAELEHPTALCSLWKEEYYETPQT